VLLNEAPFALIKTIPDIDANSSLGIFECGHAKGEPMSGAPSPKPRF